MNSDGGGVEVTLPAVASPVVVPPVMESVGKKGLEGWRSGSGRGMAGEHVTRRNHTVLMLLLLLTSSAQIIT